MGEEREIPAVRTLLIVVLAILTTTMSIELVCESRQARYEAAWRTQRNRFEDYRRHRHQELAQQLAAGERNAEDAVEASYDADM
jgi:hypothetical protein